MRVAVASGVLFGLAVPVFAAEAGTTYRDPAGHFELALPSGWQQREPESGLALFEGREHDAHGTPELSGTFGVEFAESKPGKWDVESLMSATETALKLEFPQVKLLSRIDLKAGESASQLAVYEVSQPATGIRPFAGCVILQSGGVCLQGLLFSFEAEQQIQEILKSVKPPSGGKSLPEGPAGMSLSGKQWKLALDLAGFSLVDEETRPDGSARKRVFDHTDPRINLTVVMKPTHPGALPSVIRDERWRQLQAAGPSERDGKLWEHEGKAYFQYFREDAFQGLPLHQGNVHTFLVYDGTRIEVHVSIVSFKDADLSWLESFQQSIRIARP